MPAFCSANNVSQTTFSSWLKKRGAEILAGLYRSKRMPSILPGIHERNGNPPPMSAFPKGAWKSFCEA